MNLFEKLFEVSDSSNSLEKFLSDNMPIVYDFNNSNYQETLTYVDSGDKYIFFKRQIVNKIDFSKSYNNFDLVYILRRKSFLYRLVKAIDIVFKKVLCCTPRTDMDFKFRLPRKQSVMNCIRCFL